MGGGGGGGKDYTQEQYDWDMAKHDYDYARMKDKAAYTKDAWEVQVWNQEQKIDYQNEAQLQNWQDKEKMRIFDINNQIKAYNASVEAYETQLDYNNLAAEVASADNTRQYNDRLTAIGFQNEELLMEHGFNDEALGMKLGFSKRKLTNEIRGDKAAAAFKAEELKLKAMDAKGKVANMGQAGRTARKNMHAVISGYANQQAELLDSITRKEQAYALGMEEATVTTGFERYKADSKKALSQRQLRESMKSAGSQYEADSSKIALDKYSADLQAEANIAPEPVHPPQMGRPIDLPRPRNLEPQPIPSWEEYDKLKPIKGAQAKPSALSQAAGIIGTVATIASFAAMSDDRLKYNITRVGNSKKGIPIYTFKYRHEGMHGPTYQGTSAQDLLEMGRDDAVGQQEKAGFYYVDYGKLDVEFKQVQLA